MNHADDDQVQRLKTRKSDTFGPPGTYMVKFITLKGLNIVTISLELTINDEAKPLERVAFLCISSPKCNSMSFLSLDSRPGSLQ